MSNFSENKLENAEKDATESMCKDDFIIRIRGLPWSSSRDDIFKFFSECKIMEGLSGVHMVLSREGRPNGSAYVEFESEEDVEKALKRNNEHIGQRYIEVFKSNRKEMKSVLRTTNKDILNLNDTCVRLRGLPFECSKEEIAHFFSGLEIVRNGIVLPIDSKGRRTGEAYIQFVSPDIAEKAMGKHKEKIGHRYIEIFKSSLREINNAVGLGPMRVKTISGSNRFEPYNRMDRPGPGGMTRGRNEPSEGFAGDNSVHPFGQNPESLGTGHRVHMRGLPYTAIVQDIFDFFKPLKPVSVRILYDFKGRPSGEADVEFSSHEEAVKAMKKDKENIENRYVELFLHSEPEPFRQEMKPYSPNQSHPWVSAVDNQFGPTGGQRGFSRDVDRLGSDCGGFGPAGKEGGPRSVADRFQGGFGGLGPDCDKRGLRPDSSRFQSGYRGFGSAGDDRGVWSDSDKFQSGYGGFGPDCSKKELRPDADRFQSGYGSFGPAGDNRGFQSDSDNFQSGYGGFGRDYNKRGPRTDADRFQSGYGGFPSAPNSYGARASVQGFDHTLNW